MRRGRFLESAYHAGPRAIAACSGLALFVLAGCLQPTTTDELTSAAQPVPTIDARRSLAITDVPILARFSFERVMDQIVATSGVSGVTSTALFRQWWDTQNAGPGLALGAHCGDTMAAGLPSLNGYPLTCRPAPAEGAQAACDPFAAGSACAYIPVGLFMRFDLAPTDGRHCGEYRVVFAKASGRSETFDRNLVIFEAVARNPHVNQGIRGCQKLVRAWADLSALADPEDRADRLEEIYFDGYQEFDPIIQASSFGDNVLGAGQVRTNQFMQPASPRVWSLREAKILRQCAGASCTLRFVPVSDKVNPFGALFASPSADPRAASFQGELLGRLAGLTAATVSGIGLDVSDVYNSGQSEAAIAVTETQYPVHFGDGATPFRASLTTALAGSGIGADDLVDRVQAMSCAGCHRFSSGVDIGGGLVWPASLGFTHVSERDADLEVVGGVTRYAISAALTDHFLFHRRQLAQDFLANVPRPSRPPSAPIGGRWTH
jgi:hypothetical protein